MPEGGIKSVVVDTDVLVCSVRSDESPKRQERSRDLRSAMFRLRITWVQCQALKEQLESKKKTLMTPRQVDAISAWESSMARRGLYRFVKHEVNDDLRSRIQRELGQREHDVHLVEAALASDRCVCSGDKKACIPLCEVAGEVPELQTICWLCLDDKELPPARALEYKLSEPQLEKRRLSLGHPFNLEVAGRDRGDRL